MTQRIPQSTAFLCVFKAYLASDHVTEATSKTIAITISKNGGAFGNPNAGALNATEISSGWYKVSLDTTDTGTTGPLAIRGAVATIDDVGVLLEVVKATNGGYTALPDTAVTTNASLITSGTSTAQLSVSSGLVTLAGVTHSGAVIPTVTTVTNQLTAAQIATGVWTDTTAGDFTTSASIGKSVMNGVALGTGLTVNDITTKTGYSLSQSFPSNFSSLGITAGGHITTVDTVTTVTNQLTAAAIATGVWTDTTAGDFTTSLSVGKSIMNGVTLGTGLTVNDITTKSGYSLSGTQTFNVTGNITGNLSGSVGSVTGAVGSVTGLTASNLDTTISSRMATYTQPTGFLAATFPGTVASTTNITSITGNITGNLSGSVGSVTGAIGSVTAGVTVTTNNDKTGYTASTVSDKTGYALTSAYDPAKTASQAGDAMALTSGERTSVADAMLDRDMSVGTDSGSTTVRTVRQALRFLRNKWAISAGTLTVYKEDDAASSWSSTVVTTAGNPVSSSDPAGP